MELLINSLKDPPHRAVAPNPEGGTPCPQSGSKLVLSSTTRPLRHSKVLRELPFLAHSGHIALDNVSPMGEVVHFLNPHSHQYEACWSASLIPSLRLSRCNCEPPQACLSSCRCVYLTFHGNDPIELFNTSGSQARPPPPWIGSPPCPSCC